MFLKKNKAKAILFLGVLYVTFCFVLSFQNKILKSIFYDKSWVHRVNSIEKMKLVANNFTGIEIDVVFNENEGFFDVNHPPVKSIHLPLKTLISNDNNNLKYWIDFKNLSLSNSEASLNRLEEITNLLKINKNRFIIESRNPEYLKIFSEKGYVTSYYLPSNLTENKQLLNIVKTKNKNYKTTFISSDLKQYKTITNNFPNEKILTWLYSYKQELSFNPLKVFKKSKSFYQKYRVLSNKKISVILFSLKTKADR